MYSRGFITSIVVVHFTVKSSTNLSPLYTGDRAQDRMAESAGSAIVWTNGLIMADS